MKATATAPSNIAFIKYWGKRNTKLRLPENSSISMSLDKCLTTTTVEFSKDYEKDLFEMIGSSVSTTESSRVFKHLDRIREMAKINLRAKVVTKNTFPKSSGIASSASGFAALTVASVTASGLYLSEKDLSILARLGSGSACRSIPEGFVEWEKGYSNDTSFAYSLYNKDYWDLVDVLAIVDYGEKKIGSSKGHAISKKSIFKEVRLKEVNKLLATIKKAFKEKDFKTVGEVLEKDTIYMHSVMMSSSPPLYYWNSGTMAVVNQVELLRGKGVECYFSIDAGSNVHVICEGKNACFVEEKLKSMSGVFDVIVNKPAKRARIIKNHLF